jgi:hypothetical protein
MAMFNTLEVQTAFLAQLSADVAALKFVVSRIGGPEVEQALIQESKARFDIAQKVVESHKLTLADLRTIISKIPS